MMPSRFIMRQKQTLRSLIWLVLTVLLSVAITAQTVAQRDDCPAYVQDALLVVGENCDGLGRNAACYGFTQVDATFAGDVPEDFFTQPADQADLVNLVSLRTQPLNDTTETWGVAVMNVQANVPNTVPGQAVTFLVMGDAEIENRVEPEQAFIPGEPQELAIVADAAIHSVPSTAAAIITQTADGDLLPADAANVDATWFRVLVGEQVGWVQRTSLVEPEADSLADLPSLNPNGRTPMQAFYFSTGIGSPRCSAAPNSVTVRSPENLAVDLTVNGVDVRVGSTISFQNVTENEVAFIVHQGTLETVDGSMVTTGQTLQATTDDEGNVIVLNEVRPATPEELSIEDAFGPVVDSIDSPTEADETSELETTETPLDDDTRRFNAQGELVHIVQAGETLFGIARFYNASMPAIITRNSLSDPRRIFVGQELVIPNPGGGFVGVRLPNPPDDVPTRTEEPTTGLDCARLAPVSPTAGLAFGRNTFTWNGVNGATQYRIAVTNLENGQRYVFDTDGAETSLTVSIDERTTGFGFDFAWTVIALVNSESTCESSTVTLQREAVSAPAPVGPSFVASWSCLFLGKVDFSWSGALSTDTITLNWIDSLNTAGVNMFSGASGSVTVVVSEPKAGTVTSSSGATVTLPDLTSTCP